MARGVSRDGAWRYVDAALLGFLIVDGFIVGLLSVFLTYLRIGDAAVPIGVVIALVGNTTLVWLASRFTASPWRWAPLLAWFITMLAAGFTGPGGDVVLLTDWRAIALLIGGVVGPCLIARYARGAGQR